jgi:type II secretory pathway pseudopilin PulG
MTRSRRRSSAVRQGGFTLVELVIGMIVMIEVIIAVLLLFDLNNKLSRVQTNVAEMQQSLRIAQYDIVRSTRAAGRGPLPLYRAETPYPPLSGLPADVFNGHALRVMNDVPADTLIAGNGTPEILEGTDVLTLRGVFSTPVYQRAYDDITTFTLDPPDPNPPLTGTVTLTNFTPTGVPQNLQPWADAKADNRPEAVLLVSALDDSIYGVVELNPQATVINGTPPTSVTLAFNINSPYLGLNPNGAFSPVLRNTAYVGLLEEYRFYIREDFQDPGAPSATTLTPKLSRARVYPGTDTPWGTPGVAANAQNLRADIADNIHDLQLAVALDLDNDGTITEADPPADDDEWLFNAPDDDSTDETIWWPPGNPEPRAYYLRVTALALTDRRDRTYSAPTLTLIEDHDYTSLPMNTDFSQRMFRRRLQQSIVDLRNL